MGDSKQTAMSSIQIEGQQVCNRSAQERNGNAVDDPWTDEMDKLDQIRDMLFGRQIAELQGSYQRLDGCLNSRISDLRTELSSSAQELKQQIENTLQQLRKNLHDEQAELASQIEDIRASISSANSDMLTKMDLEAKRIEDVLNQKNQETTRRLDAMVDALQDAKADRASLATLFSQVAKKLGS